VCSQGGKFRQIARPPHARRSHSTLDAVTAQSTP